MEERILINIFAKRFKQLLDTGSYDITDITRLLGLRSVTTVYRYLKATMSPKISTVKCIADIYNVNPDWLMGYDVPMNMTPIPENPSMLVGSKFYMCPVYGQIFAGQPNWAEECIEGRIPIDPDMMGIVNPEEHFFLRVNGESMNKIIRNGAFALIHKQDMVDNGDIAVVLVNGDVATLKKFTRQGDLIILEPQSTDSSQTTQVYDKTTPIKILGKYVGKMEINK